MKVSDVMSRSVIIITEDAPLKEAARLIFSLGVAGIPVVRDKKLIGVVTEQIILSKMHPTLEDLIDDYVHARDFDSMIKNIHSVLNTTVKDVMNTNIMTISPDAPLMQAHSLMQVNNFARLPVVDAKNELMGVISQGDIFRTVFKDEMPELERERYAGFISKYYDQIVDWNNRFDKELPALFRLLESKKVERILDVGCWTGEYTIGLAKRSVYPILGIDSSIGMVQKAKEKRAKLPLSLRKRVNFELTDYKNMVSISKHKYDAVLSMGNSLAYNPINLNSLFENLSKLIADKAVFVIHLCNFNKVLKSKNRMLNTAIREVRTRMGKKEQLSVEFLDSKNKSDIFLNSIIFSYDGTNWINKGITTISMNNIDRYELKNILNKIGFKKVEFFGNMGGCYDNFGELSFETPFDPEESDWLNVVAEK